MTDAQLLELISNSSLPSKEILIGRFSALVNLATMPVIEKIRHHHTWYGKLAETTVNHDLKHHLSLIAIALESYIVEWEIQNEDNSTDKRYHK